MGSRARPIGRLLLVFFVLAALCRPEPAAGGPRVVATITPLHSLAAALMEGVGEPVLLLPPGLSPHEVSLKPSRVRALREADLVVWVGSALETFLPRYLEVLKGDRRHIPAADLPGMVLWPARFDDGDHDHGQDEGARIDPHLWLDPQNARTIATHLAAELAALDPANAARYGENLARLQDRIAALDETLAARLAPLAEIPFIVYHDAYQYLERRYGLASRGALSPDPHRPRGARGLQALKQRIAAEDIPCVFAEPQYRAAAVAALVRGTEARAAVLDPLGRDLRPGPESYLNMMKDLAANLEACLGAVPGQ